MIFEQDFLENHSDEAFLQELKRVADLHPARSLTKTFFDANARCSSSAIQRRFGSWKEALNRAGLVDRYKGGPEPTGLDDRDGSALRNMRIEKKYFVNLLQEAAKKQGKKNISLFEFDAAQMGVSSSAIRKYFGSWSKALLAADLDAERTWQHPISREECFANLSILWKALGRQPTYFDLKKPYLGAKPYERIWGNFSKAMVEFRETPEGQECLRLFPDERSDTRTRGLDKEGLLVELKRIAALVGGNVISKAEIMKHSRIDPRTFERRFGSWENAIGEAGLNIADTAKRYSDEELLTNLMETWEILGHRPTCAEMSLPVSKNPAATYVKRFGSWKKAVLAFLRWVEQDQPDVAIYSTVQAPEETSSEVAASVPAESESLVLPNGQRDPRRSATHKQRFRILKRDGYKCCICGHSQSDGCKLVIDHKIYPWSKGGRTVDPNLWTLCYPCNSGKGADDL